MTRRELADLCDQAAGFDAETLRLLANTLLAQAEEIERLKTEATLLANQSFITIKSWKNIIHGLVAEIDALKAAAIVQGNTKLAEWAKVAKHREAIKAAWKRINGGRGWLSCMDTHDCRCPKFHDGRADCTCGADAFRKLMEE